MTDMEYMVNALMNLRPGAGWCMAGKNYASLEWQDEAQSKPTEDEFLAEVDRLRAEYISKEYQRLRAPEYPSITDQLDALWKGGDAAKEMLARVQAVKAQYPKPEET